MKPILALSTALLFVSCDVREAPKKSPLEERFTISETFGYGSYSVIRDNKSGRCYLAAYKGGLIEIEP